MKKEIGNTKAMAMTVVKPGRAPTNMPSTSPRLIKPKVSQRMAR